jgi:peptidoglycan/LPS O-acetylase OafA/YrhL
VRTDVVSAVASRSAGFRRDVQGLRALAVVLVVVFHTGSALPGGFIGVDVFFVLSGFLIIGLLDREALRSGRIDLRMFFARRARRLLPALALVTTATVIAAVALVELGSPLRTVTRTAVGASAFLANAVLYRDADYFAPAAKLNPLLHTWSLSVEEQFYFVVPILLAGALVLQQSGRLGALSRRSWWTVLIGAGSLASFALNVALVDLGLQLPGITEPLSLAFYAPVTRAWQFGAGGLLALAAAAGRISRVGRSPLLLPLGLALIVGAALLFDADSSFPGVRAMLPVAGTLLALVPGIDQASSRNDRAARALSTRPMVVIGDLSYSWYLWHWPAIVLARAAFGESTLVAWAAAVGSLGLARLSQRHVEERFRSDAQFVGKRAAWLAALCIALPLSVALGVGVLNDRVGTSVGLGDGVRPWSIESCLVSRSSDEPWPREVCLRGGEQDGLEQRVDILLIGDSHADSIGDGLAEAAERLGLSVGSWSVEGQPPVGNSSWTARFRDLDEAERPAVVVIANRSSNELDPDNTGRWTDRAVAGDEAASLWGETVREGVIALRDLGPHVLWVLNVPEFPGGPVRSDSVPTLLRPTVRARTITPTQLDDIRGLAVQAESVVLEPLDRVTVIDPADVLCSPECRNADETTYLYSDGHHLSAVGSIRLADLLEQAIRDALGR